jgi:transcription initiation factor IIE alpha subunit
VKELSFERENVYSLNFQELELPDVSLSKSKKAQILTHLYLYRMIDINDFSNSHNIHEELIKDYIQLLIQALVIRGYYRKNRFILASIYRYPSINPGRLNSLRKSILGLLAQSKKTSISNLSKILRQPKTVIISNISFLVSRGVLIGVIKDMEFIASYVWKPTEKIKINANDTFLVGTCMMLRNAELSRVSKLTGFSEEHILERITALMHYRKLEATIQLTSSMLRGDKLAINIEKYLIAPRILPVGSLTGDEKDVVGFVLIKGEVSIKELSHYISKEPKEIIEILSFLTARGTFQFVFNNNNKVVPVVIPDLKPTETIEEMASLSLFNYEALFGLLSTQEKISLKKLSVLMNRSADEILDGIITLYLEGFVSCTLRGSIIYIDSLRRYSRTQEGTLERWEKIVLGMVIAKSQITTKEIAEALGISKFDAKEKMYSFYGKGLIKGNISNNTLEPDEIPVFPPLVQLDDLPIHFQEIFGYIISNERVTIRNIMKFWEKSDIAVKNIIYELVGSGILNVSIKGTSVYLNSHQKYLPSVELRELGEIYIKVVNEIEKIRRKRVKLTTVAEKASMHPLDVFKLICQLIAHGYYTGSLKASYFEKTGKLILPSRKNLCLNCGHELKSSNEPCSSCQQMPPKCSVCQGLVKRGDIVVECPSCNNLAHQDHMSQWMRIKQECPICKTKISKRTLKKYQT